ncbi:MAG: MotA/TolQ/ExbB proton channel family protein [Flavobacteriales bacterium]|nr:MotA/TolQ/ExbB proton channel family protein [Flavobacteriales bacterium]
MKLLFINTASAQNAVIDVAEQAGEEKTLSILELMTSGGIGGQLIMLTLSILSVVAIYIFVERFLTIRKAGEKDAAFMNGVKDSIQKSDLATAKALCVNTDSPIARMLEKGIARIGRPLNDISAAVENVGKLETYKLEKNLATLATISGAAPMIGFLGTVIGMILAFHEMASAGGQVNPAMLAGGIYTAMTTTVAGLVVGIMAYLGYNLLVAKVEDVVFQMEASSTEFIDLLHEPA